MGCPGGGDVQQVAGRAGVRVARRDGIRHDHVVELQPFDLGDLGHVDAGLEGEVVADGQAQPGDLRPGERLPEGQGRGGVPGDDRGRATRLAGDERAQRFGEEGHHRSLLDEAEQLHRRPFPGAARRQRIGQRTEDVAGQPGDLPGAAIAGAQGLELDPGHADALLQLWPALQRVGEDQLLRHVPGQGQRVAAAGVVQDLQLHRAQVLRLVLPLASEAKMPAKQIPASKKKNVWVLLRNSG